MPHAPYQQQGELARAEAAPMTLQSATERMASWLERAWMSRYLNRQLSGEESAWFEAYVLDKSELLAEIDADTRLRDTLMGRESQAFPNEATNSSSSLGEVSTTPSANRGFPSKHTSFRGWGPSWVPLAASLIVGVGVGALAMHGKLAQESPPTHESFASKIPGIIANPTRLVFDAQRGAEDIVQVEHKDSSSAYVLIEIGVPLGVEEVRLHIQGEDDRKLLRSNEGFVSFLLPRDVLQSKIAPEISYSLNGRPVTQPLHLILREKSP